jgi:hypothetical protein
MVSYSNFIVANCARYKLENEIQKWSSNCRKFKPSRGKEVKVVGCENLGCIKSRGNTTCGWVPRVQIYCYTRSAIIMFGEI